MNRGHVLIEEPSQAPKSTSISTDEFLKKSLNLFQKTFKNGRSTSGRKRGISGSINYVTDSATSSATSLITHAKKKSCRSSIRESFIYLVGPDILSQCMSYLTPPEAIRFLTMPLSKNFRKVYTSPDDIWRTLCISGPFFANINEEEEDDDDFFPFSTDHKFRNMYFSFVECYQYLKSLEEHKYLPNILEVKQTSIEYASKVRCISLW